MSALEYAQTSFGNDTAKKAAARAICILTWLNYTAWEDDMNVLLDRINRTEDLNAAFQALKKNASMIARLHHIAITLTFIFGEGLNSSEWHPSHGAPLVEELWEIINYKTY